MVSSVRDLSPLTSHLSPQMLSEATPSLLCHMQRSPVTESLHLQAALRCPLYEGSATLCKARGSYVPRRNLVFNPKPNLL